MGDQRAPDAGGVLRRGALDRARGLGPASAAAALRAVDPDEQQRRQAEILALSSGLLAVGARSSAGVTASAMAAVCLVVVLAGGVWWSLMGRMVPEVPPAATSLEIVTLGGLGFAEHRPAPHDGAEPPTHAPPDSTASLPGRARVPGSPAPVASDTPRTDAGPLQRNAAIEQDDARPLARGMAPPAARNTETAPAPSVSKESVVAARQPEPSAVRPAEPRIAPEGPAPSAVPSPAVSPRPQRLTQPPVTSPPPQRRADEVRPKPKPAKALARRNEPRAGTAAVVKRVPKAADAKPRLALQAPRQPRAREASPRIAAEREPPRTPAVMLPSALRPQVLSTAQF